PTSHDDAPLCGLVLHLGALERHVVLHRNPDLVHPGRGGHRTARTYRGPCLPAPKQECPVSHPRNRLDEVIHSPVRFSIVATLSASDQAEFRFVRDAVEISDSALSKQISVLEKAEYVKVTKFPVGRRTRTSLSLTAKGRKAFAEHVRALREIAAGAGLAEGD